MGLRAGATEPGEGRGSWRRAGRKALNCLRILSSPPGCASRPGGRSGGGPAASFQLDGEPGWHRTGVSKWMPFFVQEGGGVGGMRTPPSEPPTHPSPCSRRLFEVVLSPHGADIATPGTEAGLALTEARGTGSMAYVRPLVLHERGNSQEWQGLRFPSDPGCSPLRGGGAGPSPVLGWRVTLGEGAAPHGPV